MTKAIPKELLSAFASHSRTFASVSALKLEKDFDSLCLSLLGPGKKDLKNSDGMKTALCVIVESVKLNLEVAELSDELKANSVPDPVVRAICRCYETHVGQLSEVVSRVGWHPALLLDVDWKVAHQAMSDVKEDVDRALYTISLKVQDCDTSEPRDETFQCTAEQLQDMVWKLKEASKAVEKASKIT